MAGANDATRLAEDPVHKLLVGRDPVEGADLASQPTLSRFENSPDRKQLYRLGEALAECVIERHRRRLHAQARLITLDLDPSDDTTHGAQQLTFFNRHYDTWCYLPVMGFMSFNDAKEQYLFTAVLRPDWLTPDVILIVFLPALVFEASVKIDVRSLIRDFVPLLLLVTLGVLMATLVTGYLVHWATGLPVLLALLFGSIIPATDPISVLAIFKDLRTVGRLSLIIEGKSLLNDGTAVVLFEVLLAGIVAGNLSIAKGAGQFVLAVVDGAALGIASGYVASKITAPVNDPQIEITLTTMLAYGSYLLAHHLHLSGVIATVAAGLTVGNFGAKKGMSVETRTAMQSFWEYVSFVINSLVFLLIGLEVHVGALLHAWRPVLFAIAAVLIGRALSVYLLVPISNLFAKRIPLRWQHVAVWDGLRGALALALVLSLDSAFPYRNQILDITFGVVIFSILVQGLTMKPFLRMLSIADNNA